MQGIQHYQHQLLHYFDIESLIPQNHLLRKIDKTIDLSFVRELTAAFYCRNVERMWKMEGIISEAKQRHGLSRAKYRGLMKTQVQAYMVASAIKI